jgi:hypothetical protein
MDWNVNLLQSPNFERASILPRPYKDQIIEKIERHIEWLEPQDKLSRAVHGYRALITFINQPEESPLALAEFFKMNDSVDRVRGEKFEDVFPEYADLRNHAG